MFTSSLMPSVLNLNYSSDKFTSKILKFPLSLNTLALLKTLDTLTETASPLFLTLLIHTKFLLGFLGSNATSKESLLFPKMSLLPRKCCCNFYRLFPSVLPSVTLWLPWVTCTAWKIILKVALLTEEEAKA